jgi:hypothetical protein
MRADDWLYIWPDMAPLTFPLALALVTLKSISGHLQLQSKLILDHPPFPLIITAVAFHPYPIFLH